VAEETFTITYDGSGLVAGRMSVRDLAPALIALSDAIREAQQLTHPGEPEPSLDIQALREGSFAIDLLLREGAGLLQSAIDLLSGRESTAGANLAGLVAGVFGAFQIIKRLATRRIRQQEQLADGTVRITFDDGQSITIPRDSLRLAADKPFREAARQVVAPVAREGVEVVIFSSAREGSVEVTKPDLPGFEVPGIEEQPLADQEREVALRPVNVAFTEGNKWRVSDGESTFFATVTDLQFLNRVETAQEVFAKSDILRARLRTRQWRTSDGDLRTEHQILEVLEHVAGPRQVPLPFEEPAADSAERDWHEERDT
jgi:hypothetical protein